jgi:hypothetical protein
VKFLIDKRFVHRGFHLTLLICSSVHIGGPYEKSVDWRQCAALMQREAVIVMPSCSGRVTL